MEWLTQNWINLLVLVGVILSRDGDPAAGHGRHGGCC